MFLERQEDIAQVEPEIDGLLGPATTLGELRERNQRLVEPRHRFPVRRADGSL